MNKIITFLDSFSLWIHKIGTTVLLPLMALIISLDVIMRYIFNAPLLWSHEVNGILLISLFLCSLIYCWDRGRHVRMEIFYTKFRGRLKAFADIVTGLTGIFVFCLLSIPSFRDIPYMIKTNETGEELGIILWPFKLLLALISTLFVLRLVLYIFSIIQKKELD